MRFRWLVLAASLSLAACSGSSGGDTSAVPSALVSLATAQTGSVASTQTLYGMVEQNADTQFTLSAPVEAVVSRIAASVGSPVSRGQLVVALSPSPATRADSARLASEAQTAKAAYARAQRLRADGLMSDADVESARTAAQSASAALSALSVQQGQLAIRAPGPGFVRSVDSAPGNLVSPGTPIVTISRSGALQASFGIDPSLVAHLSRGAGMQLDAPGGGPGATVPIVSVDPSADPQTRLASIYVTVPARFQVGAGQPLKGTVTVQMSGDTVTVPYSALLDDAGQPYVFVVSKGVAHRRDVSIGATDGKIVAIANGVAAGDKVVTQGGTALEDGMKVRTK